MLIKTCSTLAYTESHVDHCDCFFQDLNGRAVRVSFASERPSGPRSYGGNNRGNYGGGDGGNYGGNSRGYGGGNYSGGDGGY